MSYWLFQYYLLRGNLIYDRWNIRNLVGNGILPAAIVSVIIYRRHPSLSCSTLDLFQLVKALRLKNEIRRRTVIQPDDKIRHIVVHLAIVQVRNGKPKSGVFHKTLDAVRAGSEASRFAQRLESDARHDRRLSRQDLVLSGSHKLAWQFARRIAPHTGVNHSSAGN